MENEMIESSNERRKRLTNFINHLHRVVTEAIRYDPFNVSDPHVTISDYGRMNVVQLKFMTTPEPKTVESKDQEMSKRFPDDNDTTPRVPLTPKEQAFIDNLTIYWNHLKDSALPTINNANGPSLHCETVYRSDGYVVHTITCKHKNNTPKPDSAITVVLKRVGNTLIYNGKLIRGNADITKPNNVFDFTIDNQRARETSHIILYVNQIPVIDRPIPKVIGAGIWDNAIHEMTRIVKNIYKFDIEIIFGK